MRDTENWMTFQDETGKEYLFALLGVVEYEGREYAVTLPEPGCPFDNGLVHIFEIAEELDSDTDTFLGIDDPEVVDAVYRLYLDSVEEEADDDEEEET